MIENICEKLDAFLDDDLDDIQRHDFQTHLTSCSSCNSLIEQQTTKDDALRIYAQSVQPAAPFSVPSLNVPRTNSRHKFAFGIMEVCAVAGIAFAIWFAMNRTTDPLSGQNDKVTAQNDNVAAPPESSTEVIEEQEAVNAEVAQERKTQPPSKQATARKLQELFQSMSEHIETLRKKQIQLAQVEAFASQSKDPVIALKVIQEVIGKDFGIEKPAKTPPNPSEQRTDDRQELLPQVKNIEVDKQLIPLMVKRNKYVAEFGERHPAVREIDAKIALIKDHLRQSVKQPIDHNLELPKLMRDTQASAAAENLDKLVLPLLTEREKFASEFGERHPTVKRLDAEIEQMKSELTRIARTHAERLDDLRRETENGDPKLKAVEKIVWIIKKFRNDIRSLELEIAAIDGQIAQLKIATQEEP